MSRSNVNPPPSIEWVAPDRDLSELVLSIAVTRAGEGQTDYAMPAFSGQLVSAVQGHAQVHFSEGPPAIAEGLLLKAPMLRAAQAEMHGPALFVVASLSPLGWNVLTGLPANEVHDRLLAAQDSLPTDRVAPLANAHQQLRAGQIETHDFCRVFQDLMRAQLGDPRRAPRKDHVALLAAIEDWLQSAFNPAVGELYERVGLGPRQVQRLCKRYYGVPPAQLLKRYRAIRAAMLLANDDLPPHLRDAVLSAYFDQAHLINDIRRYTGSTPRRLRDTALMQDMLDPEGHGRSGWNFKNK